MSVSLRDLQEVLERPALAYGLGHLTLREHNAVCAPGLSVSLDSSGDEVCVGTPDDFFSRPIVIGGGSSRRAHSSAHPTHRHGMGAASDLDAFRTLARSARSRAAAGDVNGSRSDYEAAAAAFTRAGSPSAYQDELDYARDAAYGDAAAQVQQQQQQDSAAAANAVPDSVSFTDDPLAALYFHNIDPVRVATGGLLNTEEAAAEQRDIGDKTGLDFLSHAAAPQSGRDATTKAPLPLPEATKGILVGALVGAAAGAGLGGLVSGPNGPGFMGGGLLGLLLGAATGYATGGKK